MEPADKERDGVMFERTLLADLETFVNRTHTALRRGEMRRNVLALAERYGYPVRVVRARYFDRGQCAYPRIMEFEYRVKRDGLK